MPALRCVLVAAAAGSAACAGDQPSGPDVSGRLAAGPPALAGRIHTLAPTTLRDVTVRVRTGGWEAAATVDADGSFVVPLPDTLDGPGSLSVEPGPSAALLPAWIPIGVEDAGRPYAVLVLPRTWTIARGAYAGSEVPVRPDLAAGTPVLPSFWGAFFPFRQDGFSQTVVDGGVWTGAFLTWDAKSYPIPVAFDRGASGSPLSARDSVAFWSHVDRLEEILGRDLFRPATAGRIGRSGDSRAGGRVLLRLDPTLPDRGQGTVEPAGTATWSLVADASAWSGGRPRRLSFVSANIARGSLAFHDAAFLGDRRLVIHELMHVLGAGHGCGWRSVQTYCSDLASDVPTPEDVAHLEVLEAVRALERRIESRWGLLSAVMGVRAVRYGLDPVPWPETPAARAEPPPA